MNTLRQYTGVLGAGLLLATSALAADVTSAQVASTPLPNPQDMFSWTTQQKVVGFSHSAQLFSTETMQRGYWISPLWPARPDQLWRASQVRYQYGSNANGTPHTGNTVDDYMKHSKATALLVLKDGNIALERYAMGITPWTLWDSKSAAKSITSTLLGMAIKDGYISSLDDPIDMYVTELHGTAYQGVPLRAMLHMASGVAWNENYLDPASDISALLKCVNNSGSNTPPCAINLLATRPHAIDPATGVNAVPGAVFNYSTGEAFLTGLAIQRATRLSLAQYMQRKLWQPLGMEANGNWWTWNGVSFGAGGFNATLHDYGRWGVYVMNNGRLPDGTRTLPEHWMRDATTWTMASALPYYADNGQYGYYWWFAPAYDDNQVGATNFASPIYANIGAPLQNTDNPAGAVPVQARGPVQGQPGSVSDWTFEAQGAFGQLIAINQREHLVVVQWSVWDKPSPTCCDPTNPENSADDPYNEQGTFLNAMLTALH
ncbi:serine hydrolase domain-containing protein [Silvimonas iriomotensis]|uniref:Serine hydrolase n=1 Tax=Silvimonas iriomotensis TaxID=449662 RepID=A0ABQ2P430_9NEIS|nr:serine hydrolase [Silvimonas iriomotensis]GGP17619.1 serine hydrolase [Silvimonas iriomotensis]